SFPSGLLREIPALETTPSSRPNFSRAAATARSAVSSSATSPSVTAAWRSLPNLRARPAPGRSSGAMRHPDRSNRRAVANPMPLAAPVTIATRLADRAIPASVLRPTVDGRGGVCRSRFCPHVTLIARAAACHLEEIMEQRRPNGRERLHPYLHGENGKVE